MKDQKPAPNPDDIEELPDAWERFEKAFDSDTVMKAKPKPRSAAPTPKAKERPASKGRVHKGKAGR